jgi:hypothetical protein
MIQPYLPILHIVFQDEIADEDKIATRFGVHATNTLTWKSEVTDMMCISRFSGGKIVEEWQLGVQIPTVAYRLSWQGTHLGELWGMQPTGKKITRTGMLIDHFSDGKIVEEWQWMDWLGMMRQLGLIPELAGV